MAICAGVAWSRWLCLECLIVCVTGGLSQRLCTNDNGFIENINYFLERNIADSLLHVPQSQWAFRKRQRTLVTYNNSSSSLLVSSYPMQYGDCSFGQSLCNYTQFCTDSDAKNWRQNLDHAECPGKSGRYDSFSVLMSPLFNISHVTCLTFEYTQELPGMLSVYVASTSLIIVMPEERTQKQRFINFTTELSSTSRKLVFRARSPHTNYTVQLRNVKLQPGSCTQPGGMSTVSESADYQPETTVTLRLRDDTTTFTSTSQREHSSSGCVDDCVYNS